MKTLTAALISLLLIGCSTTDRFPQSRRDCDGRDGVKVYFVSFFVETFVAVTKENITRPHSSCNIIDRTDSRLAVIESLFRESRENEFNNLVARVKIDFGNAEPAIYIDRDGHVERGAKFYRIESGNLRRVERLISAMVYGD